MSSPSALDRHALSSKRVHQQGSLAVSDRSSRNFGSGAYLALLLLCVVTVFWKVALTKQYTLMAWSDSAGQTYPWSQFMAATFRVTTENQRTVFLVISETSYPGWSATINGKRQRVFRTDGALMGLFVQPGRNLVDFVFRPKYLVFSLALPLIAVAFLLAATAYQLLRTPFLLSEWVGLLKIAWAPRETGAKFERK